MSRNITLNGTPDAVKAYSSERALPPVQRRLPSDRINAFVGQRVRVHTADRKMAVPGRLQDVDGVTALCTNWGLVLNVKDLDVTRIDTKDTDTGRWVEAYAVAA